MVNVVARPLLALTGVTVKPPGLAPGALGPVKNVMSVASKVLTWTGALNVICNEPSGGKTVPVGDWPVTKEPAFDAARLKCWIQVLQGGLFDPYSLAAQNVPSVGSTLTKL